MLPGRLMMAVGTIKKGLYQPNQNRMVETTM